jgi:hypothetical protein
VRADGVVDDEREVVLAGELVQLGQVGGLEERVAGEFGEDGVERGVGEEGAEGG